MKRSFLSKLHTNGLYCIIGALLLFPGVLLYQLLVLVPQGYGDALASPGATLRWINTHNLQFVGYRLLLILGFALMISLPFTLFRIIVAQEILGTDEEDSEDDDEEEGLEDEGETDSEGLEDDDETDREEPEETDKADSDASGMPAFAWRGRGYAVIAAWGGLFGLFCTVVGTLASTVYLVISAASASMPNTLPGNFAAFSGTFAFITYTVGGGFLAIACLFFGMVIARRGRNLWPDVWVLFSYMALALAALLSGSAVEVAFAPNAGNAGQAILTTPAILFFAIWVLWFGIMLVRLQPE
ncbi:MAG TPA: hypothetical protein VJ761_05405 [Ktedonobacteraceae bacterium]|nr:hypothetical protein [Ktedonobacteraceae bacterium]